MRTRFHSHSVCLLVQDHSMLSHNPYSRRAVAYTERKAYITLWQVYKTNSNKYLSVASYSLSPWKSMERFFCWQHFQLYQHISWSAQIPRTLCQGSPDQLAGQEEEGGPLRAPWSEHWPGVGHTRLVPIWWADAFSLLFFTSDKCESGFSESFFPHKTLIWPIQLARGQAR